MKLITSVVSLGAIMLMGAGCASSPTAKAPQQTAPTQRIADRDFVATEVPIPENFPKDFPRYPGSKVFSLLSDESQAILSLTSEDDAVTIMAWNRQQFLANGYVAGEKGAQGNAATETFTKDGIKFYVNTIDQGTSKPKTLFSLRREPIRTE
ncbi:hypothetical protein K8R04_00685 [Candidatus Uhrbacteria bacterium]|nr:hypothetical protein [Candidatus Uhrbacteria bacterium]